MTYSDLEHIWFVKNREKHPEFKMLTITPYSIYYLLYDVRPADKLSALYLHAIYARERGDSEHAHACIFLMS
jgi:hypothetical protein